MIQIDRTKVGRLLFVILATCNHLGGCSKDTNPEPVVTTDTLTAVADSVSYADWQVFRHRRIRIHYPEFHPQMGAFEDMANNFSVALEKSAPFFGLIPPDTIDLYFYTGPGQSQEMTGSLYPFVKNGIVHFALPSYYGPPMAQYYLERWSARGTRFQFLKHGIIAILDFSGQNYHQFTHNFMQNDSFVTLERLAEDTTVNSNTERWQTAEAASFVDYIGLRYGNNTLHQLYTSQQPFEDAVKGATGKRVPDLQLDWLRFVDVAIKAIETRDNSFVDSIVRLRGGQ